MTTWLLVLAKKLAGAGERKSGCQGGACRKEEDEEEDAFVGVGGFNKVVFGHTVSYGQNVWHLFRSGSV